SWSYALAASSLTDGVSYTVRSRATDNDGNVETPAAGNTFTYDTTAPAVAVSFPANNGNYNAAGWAAGAPIAGTATDATSGIAGAGSIQLTITQVSTGFTWNGSSFASGTNTVSASGYDGSSAWTYSFPNTNFNLNGSYTVSASATDRANNTGTSATNSFKYDTQDPVSSASSPTYSTSTGFTVSYTASDPLKNSSNSGLADVELWATTPGGTPVLFATDSTPGATGSFNFTGTIDGS